jgi:hypothetical protein
MAALFNLREYSLRILPCDRSMASSKASCPVKCDLSAASFKFQYLLCSLRSTSTRLCLLPRVLFPYSFLYYRVSEKLLFHLLLHYYTECPRRNVPDFGRVFLMLKYTDITQNTYVLSWTVTEIMAREVWNFYSCYTLTVYQIHIKTGRNMWFL